MTQSTNRPWLSQPKKNGPAVARPLRLRRDSVVPSASAPNGDGLTAAAALKSAGGNVSRAIALLRDAQLKRAPRTHNGASPKVAARIAAQSTARTVGPDSALNPDEHWLSDTGNTMLAYQGDGNLVVYVRRNGVMPTTDPNSGWVPRWASNTYGQPAGVCVMQGDGNLVVYTPDGAPIWSSNTWGNPGSNLAIQDDENVVIYNADGAAIWSSNTWVAGSVLSGFSPAAHGFHFVNNFPDGYWEFGFLRFSTAGLCGGMSFSALDYFFNGMAVPATTSTPSATSDPLGQHINARQQESVTSNLGGWAVQILNPDDHALQYWATHDEWNKIKASLDAGVPVPIGVGIYLNGGASHQVVARGYRDGAQELWIHTYDPNNPNGDSYLHLAPGQLHWTDQFGGDWRGYFVEAYSPKTPPA